MKIALFHPWIKSRGGAERAILEFLKRTKHDVDVYTWVYDQNNTFEEFKRFNVKVVAPKIAKKISRSYILRGLFLLIALFSKIPLEKYDVFLISTSGLAEAITFRNYKPEATYAYVHTILRAAYKDDVKWNLQHRYKNYLNKFIYLVAVYIYRIFEKLAWKKIDAVIFNSKLSLERAQKHGLIKGKKYYIVYSSVDVKKFRKLKTKNYFLYVARFGIVKRQDVLLKAWKVFVEEHPNYKLVLAGNVENKKYFESIKKEVKSIKNVEIRANITDKELIKLYSNCLAGIFVPFMEDFGLVPFEFLACGKPLIAVNRGGYVELLKDAPSVIWVEEKFDSGAVANEIYNALKEFIKKENFYVKQAAKNRNYIKRLDLSWSNFAKRFDEILEKNEKGRLL